MGKKQGFGFQSALKILETGFTIAAVLVACTCEVFQAYPTLFQMFLSGKPADMQHSLENKKSNKKFHIIIPLCHNRSVKVQGDWLAIQNTNPNDR